MSENIQFNVSEDLDAGEVDAINNSFYSRFNYPWVPMALPRFTDADFWPEALNNDLGFWQQPRFGAGMKIWVAGCGTNQAVLTALRFPGAQVLGSDVSVQSLSTAEAVAQQIGLTNLELRQESLNNSRYRDQFDYVICTGVIHHNADPGRPLNSLMRSMKPDGVLELMVYNYYHRVQTTAFQKAIRLLSGSRDRPDIDRELPLTMDLVQSFPVDCQMKSFLAQQQDLPEAAVADSLLQPVEYSYTIKSLSDLAAANSLYLQSYCLNQFDRMSGQTDWEMCFDSAAVQADYDALSDLDRLQVSNLLLAEKSPMLWFYLQRCDGGLPPRSLADMNAGFLQTRFEPARTQSNSYLLQGAGDYQLTAAEIPCPAPVLPVEPLVRQIVQACDGSRTMGQLLSDLGVQLDQHRLTQLRYALASSGHPYLRALRG